MLSCSAVECSTMPTQTKARCKPLVRKHKELNLEKQCSSWLKYIQILSDGTKDLIEMHFCYRQTWLSEFNCFEYQIWKFQYFLSEYAGNLNKNILWCQIILKGSCGFSAIQSCVHFAEGQTQQQLVIVHIKNQLFLNLIFWTWCSLPFQGISDFKLAIGQSHSAWQLLTLNAELKSCNMTRSEL